MKLSRRAALASAAGAAASLAQSAGTRLSMAVAGHGFPDMAPLKKIVGDARIVALGEAAYGTRDSMNGPHKW